MHLLAIAIVYEQCITIFNWLNKFRREEQISDLRIHLELSVK